MTQGDFEDTIHAMVVRESGLGADRVIWADQGSDRPTRPFIKLDLTNTISNQHSEQRNSDNPDVDADLFAHADLSLLDSATYFPGSTVQAHDAGPDGNFNVSIVANGIGPFPNASWVDDTYTIYVGTSGTSVADLNTFLLAGTVMVPNLFGAASITTDLAFTLAGGAYAQNPLLATNIDHDELEVQLVAFSGDVTGDSTAKNILRTVRNKLGSDRAQSDLGDVALVTRGSIRDATIVLENEFEGRAILALTFRASDVNEETEQSIETVIVERTLTLEDGVTTQVDTVTYK